LSFGFHIFFVFFSVFSSKGKGLQRKAVKFIKLIFIANKFHLNLMKEKYFKVPKLLLVVPNTLVTELQKV
jgi:hypothetical protein